MLRVGLSLFCLTALIVSATPQESKDNHEKNILFNREHYDAEKQAAKERMLHMTEKICPNHTQEIKEKLEVFYTCSERIDENNETMCRVIELNLNTCIVPLFDLFERCVPKHAKGLPTYALETGRAVFKFICDTDGAHLIELGNPCILRKNHIDSRTCIKKLKKEAIKYDFDRLPEKQVLCLFIKDFQNCFDSHVRNHCDDNTTREAYIGLYKTFLCK